MHTYSISTCINANVTLHFNMSFYICCYAIMILMLVMVSCRKSLWSGRSIKFVMVLKMFANISHRSDVFVITLTPSLTIISSCFVNLESNYKILYSITYLKILKCILFKQNILWVQNANLFIYILAFLGVIVKPQIYCWRLSVEGITVFCHFRKNYLMPIIICKIDKLLGSHYNVIFSNMTDILSHLSYIFY